MQRGVDPRCARLDPGPWVDEELGEREWAAAPAGVTREEAVCHHRVNGYGMWVWDVFVWSRHKQGSRVSAKIILA